ncbi:ethanolamine utilization cobalamin adenosyltransferase [Leadbettera azotonutricia ZAS-9]|uniref:Ethanolamine utilization cobalamin adenosyltransferase n=2 Tax=Leadbettera azotonutricia TaxID=150829 RepID=F5YDZ4_LEAAZ|nr:ethanolamine utilization cobalamin adenosyltransferase [Leadbettera azotonutricia ZAS-9]
MKVLSKKPEHKTHLAGNRLVSKSHGRIAFRGMIDVLEAEVLEAQVLASGLGEEWYCTCLGEVLDYLRAIMIAEVKSEPFPSLKLFGLALDEIHQQSHDVKAAFGLARHPLPDQSMGPLVARINYLRARVREGELLAVRIFGRLTGRRQDLITAMNRLSSALWWLCCKKIAATP